MKNKFFIGTFFFSLLIAVNSFAEIYYVSSSGSDNNNGLNETSPFRSLYKINQTLSTGDTVLLKRGDTWTVTNNKVDGEGLGDGLYIKVDNITVDAFGNGNKPVIDSTARVDRNDTRGTQYYSAIQIGVRYGQASKGVTIRNLDLRGPKSGSSINAYNAGDGLTISNCDFQGAGWTEEALVVAGSGANNYLIEDCFFDQYAGNTSGYSKSVEIRGGSGHIFRRNKFYGYGPGGALRISDHGKGATIEQNFFYSPNTSAKWAWALVVRSCDGGTYLIKNNVIDMTNHDSLTSTTDLRGMAFWYDYSATNRLVYNNTFVSNGGHGAAINGMGGTTSTVNVYNNIVVGVNVFFNNDETNLHLRNNLLYGCDAITEDGREGTNINNVQANPNLRNISMSYNQAIDAMLTESSNSAIDKGYQDDNDIPTTDYNGNQRVNVDIGAFEFNSSEPTPLAQVRNLKIIP